MLADRHTQQLALGNRTGGIVHDHIVHLIHVAMRVATKIAAAGKGPAYVERRVAVAKVLYPRIDTLRRVGICVPGSI